MIVTAQTDETIDALLWRVFGNASTDLLNQTLELNPTLAGTILLSAGTKVTIPDSAPETIALNDVITLWD